MYMPLVAQADTRLPDLVIERITTTNGLSVVIRNQGGTPVVDSFWVDLYINPRSAPTGVNQIWQALGERGAVWGVRGAALPPAPGASLTLSVGDAYYVSAESVLGGAITPGTPIYAQVDSANINTTYGAVLETHERDGGAYNNITRTAGAIPGAVTIISTAAPGATTNAALPVRPVR